MHEGEGFCYNMCVCFYCTYVTQVGNIPEAEDMEWFGAIDQYNEMYDKVTARHEKPLKPFDKILPYYVNTMDVSANNTQSIIISPQ